jgi:hypothetical protein
LVILTDDEEFKNLILFFLSTKGVFDLVIWIIVNEFRPQAIESLKPQANRALVQEVLYYVTLGIREAVTNPDIPPNEEHLVLLQEMKHESVSWEEFFHSLFLGRFVPVTISSAHNSLNPHTQPTAITSENPHAMQETQPGQSNRSRKAAVGVEGVANFQIPSSPHRLSVSGSAEIKVDSEFSLAPINSNGNTTKKPISSPSASVDNSVDRSRARAFSVPASHITEKSRHSSVRFEITCPSAFRRVREV